MQPYPKKSNRPLPDGWDEKEIREQLSGSYDELARRAVACKHWLWMPGMRAIVPKNLPMAWGTTRACRIPHSVHPTMVPDLTDPATLGCLLALVREAWEPRRGSDYLASTMHTSSGWGVGARFGSEGLAAIVLPTFETEAEALVAALEAGEKIIPVEAKK